jgi:hypothetical protein
MSDERLLYEQKRFAKLNVDLSDALESVRSNHEELARLQDGFVTMLRGQSDSKKVQRAWNLIAAQPEGRVLLMEQNNDTRMLRDELERGFTVVPRRTKHDDAEAVVAALRDAQEHHCLPDPVRAQAQHTSASFEMRLVTLEQVASMDKKALHGTALKLRRFEMHHRTAKFRAGCLRAAVLMRLLTSLSLSGSKRKPSWSTLRSKAVSMGLFAPEADIRTIRRYVDMGHLLAKYPKLAHYNGAGVTFTAVQVHAKEIMHVWDANGAPSCFLTNNDEYKMRE